MNQPFEFEEVNTLRQRLLELEQSNHQYQQQVEQLTQQLTQEKTARQQAEERLQISLASAQAANERFQLAAKAVNCLIYDWQLELDRVERTDGLTRLLGYALEEAEPTGKWWSDLVHPDDLQAIQAQAWSVLAKEDYFSGEYRVLNKSNQYVYVLDQCLVVARDANGNPTRIVGSTTDISDRKRVEEERKQAELQLLGSQQFIQQIADALPGTLYVYDMLEQRNVYVNRQIGELLGYTPEQIQIYGDRLLPQLMHPDDLATLGNQIERLNQAQEGEVVDHEYRMRHADGEWRWLWSRNTVSTRTPDGRAHQVVGTVHDITDRKRVEDERKRIEDELRESEQRLQLAQQAGRIGTWEWNLLTNEVSWSDGIWTLLSLKPNSIPLNLESFAHFIHPDDREQAFQRVEAALARGDSYYDEFRVIRQDGIVCWFLAKGRVIRTPEGQPERLLGINVDITARKRIESALAESNQTLQAIIQACPLAIVGLRADGTARIWNPAAERIFGWSQQEVLGKFLPAIPDDKRGEFLNNLANTIQGQVLVGVETRRQKKGNVPFDVELWTAPVDETQAGISCVSVIADITARKQTEVALRRSEERLHSFVTANIIGILFGDLEGGIQEANDEFLRIIGYTREDLQSGNLRWIDITPPEYLPLDQAAIVEARQRGGCSPYEKEYIRKDGSRVSVLVGFGLVLAVREEAVAFILDLSDRKQAEAEREQLLKREQAARKQAEVANRVKDEFLAVLSHELRTPLNPILGWTRLLRTRRFETAAIDRALDTIERNAKLQAQLIEDLLDVSRILQGKVGLAASPVNLVTTIEAALETVRLSAEAKGIQIQTVLDAETGLVNGDANRLQQVVWNLLSNAVKFTPSGGRVEVRLARVIVHRSSVNGKVNGEAPEYSSIPPSPLTPYAQITVTDTGQGINPNFLPYVFDYFRQADSSTTRQFGGLGLGLAIVRHLVELHGGTVKAESPGHGLGATFTVQLPLLKSQGEGKEGDGERFAPSSPHSFAGLEILIVDDEADMRELIRFVLEDRGATVRVATSAAEALQQFAESVPDVLISDIGMPEMDGYALMRQIRTTLSQQGKMVAAIALTAYAGEMNQQQALAAGFQMHLSKPVEPEHLVAMIASLVVREMNVG